MQRLIGFIYHRRAVRIGNDVCDGTFVLNRLVSTRFMYSLN